MAYRSQLLTQSGLSPSLTRTAASDYDAAQADFQSAVDSGLDENSARSLYISPIDQKWSIISSSPQLVQDEKQFKQFNNEFDAANDLFKKHLADGQSVSEASGDLSPVIQKWSAVSRLPAPVNDPTQINPPKWP